MTWNPEDYENKGRHGVKIQKMRDGRWAVISYGDYLSVCGKWEKEPSASEDPDEIRKWREKHSFETLDDAQKAVANLP